MSIRLLAFVVGAGAYHLREAQLRRDFPFYHTTREILSQSRALVNNCRVTATSKKVTKDYVSLDVIHVGEKASNRVSVIFGEHSRELIGPETGLKLLQMLCENTTMGEEALKNSEFQLVLNANPLSREKVEAGNYCLRDNPRGVDLNRNWDEKWYQGIDMGEQAHGQKPFSEPETQLLRDLLSDFRPTTFLSVHSGTLGLYMPWAYDAMHMAQRNRAAMLTVLKELDAKHCRCPFGAAGREVGYNCPGTSFDWVFDHLQSNFSFAWEIYASPEESSDLRHRWEEKLLETTPALLLQRSAKEIYAGTHSDFMSLNEVAQDVCFSSFNPDTEAEYNTTVANWAHSYLDLAIKTAKHIASC